MDTRRLYALARKGHSGRMSARRLIVMRHAKAGPYTKTDHERPLTERGARDAQAAGEWLAGQGLAPDFALVSSAVRTRETWAQVVSGSGSKGDAVFTDALYAAGPQTVIDTVREAPEEAELVIFIGHNPTVENTVHLLSDGAGDPETLELLGQGYPTSALTVFDVEVPWNEIGPDAGQATAFHIGRG